MKVLVKIPTRERGFNWLKPFLNLIELPDTTILLSLDEDERYKVPGWVIASEKIVIKFAERKTKIEAINRDVSGLEWDVVIVAADDFSVQKNGYDRIVAEDMQKHFPKKDGILWYDSDNQHDIKGHITRGTQQFFRTCICTMPVIGRKYYDSKKYIYHPEYHSLYCDEEQTKVAIQEGKIKYIENRILYHEHPVNGGNVKMDGLYKLNERWYARDKAVFENRALNLNIPAGPWPRDKTFKL